MTLKKRVLTNFEGSSMEVDISEGESDPGVFERPHEGAVTAPISVFILIGKTGVGKSTFIKLLGGRDLSGCEPTVDPGTQKPTIYTTTVDGRNVILLDTPGFDDSARENLELLDELVSQFHEFSLQPAEFETQGVIFLHDISEMRFGGSQKKTLALLKALVGEEHMDHVIIGTTKWSPEGSEGFKREVGREEELLNDQWDGIYKTTRVLSGDKETAVQIVNDLFSLPPVVLLSQQEMLQPPHKVADTTAGRLAMPDGRLEKEQLERELREQRRGFEEASQRREKAFQRKLEEIKQEFEKKSKEQGWETRELEAEVQKQDTMLEGKVKGRTRIGGKETRAKSGEDTKKEFAEYERDIRKKELDNFRETEEAIRQAFEAENKKRDEKARKEAEKLEQEVKSLETTMSGFAGVFHHDRFSETVDAVIKWFQPAKAEKVSAPIPAFILMGKTGSGRSNLIRLLGGKNFLRRGPTISSGIDSCTRSPTLYITTINKQNIILLDVPGFDDSIKENLETLNEIISQLYTLALRSPQIETQGVIFLHDISEVRFAGSQKKTLQILKALVGEKNMGNVVIGTTMWGPQGSTVYERQVVREQILLRNHWGGICKNVQVREDDEDAAVRIVSELFAKPPVTLLSQEEMLLPPHTPESTTAARLILPEAYLEMTRIAMRMELQRRYFERNTATLGGASQEQVEAEALLERELGGLTVVAEKMKEERSRRTLFGRILDWIMRIFG